MTILCAGEALIDMMPCSCSDGTPGFVAKTGGAVFNTAIALGRLGRSSALCTGLGGDAFADQLRDALSRSGVDMRYAIQSARPTSLAFVRLDGGQARYEFHDENTAARMLTPGDLPALGPEVDALFLGGISLTMDPCAGTYEALLQREASERAIMLDPNIRPQVIADEALYRARLKRMLARTDLVKLSDEDLRWLSGPGAPEDAARALLDQGPRAVFVTMGAQGAFAITRDARARVAALPVPVVDTVGAGDTFNAGILAALDRMGRLSKPALASLCEEELLAALTLGNRAAAICVTRPGADPPLASELT